jgi:capsular exopolysaccharide synthesis family protein
VELIDYVRILRRRWALIILVLIACVAGAVVATKLTTPEYQASSRLIINGSSSLGGTDEVASRQLADERATAFAQIVSTGPAVQAALTRAEATNGPFISTGAPVVSASASGTDPFININVTDTDPHRAQAVANAFADVLPKVLQHLNQPTTALHEIDVLNPANLPSSPISPRPRQNLLIGFALGLVLGAGAAFVLESLDRRLKDSDDVEAATGLTVLGVIPYDMPGEPIPAESHPMSLRAEAYRKVWTNLAFVTETGPPKSIIVTSAASSEGKTSLAVNLAIACASSGQRVVLVDADLRRPMVHTYLQTPDHTGLVDVLAGTTPLSDALQISEAGHFDVLVSGPVPSNPNQLIGSQTMLTTIRQLEHDFDMVIIDTPPVLPVADALNLSVKVDGVVVVTRLGETTRDRLRRTKEALVNVHAAIIGVVPNGAIQREDSAYSYAYRYRSKRKAPDLPYAPREPEIEPHPDNLRPAGREDQTSQESSNLPTPPPSDQAATRLDRRGKHVSATQGRPLAESSPAAVENREDPIESVGDARFAGSTKMLSGDLGTAVVHQEGASGQLPSSVPVDQGD